MDPGPARWPPPTIVASDSIATTRATAPRGSLRLHHPRRRTGEFRIGIPPVWPYPTRRGDAPPVERRLGRDDSVPQQSTAGLRGHHATVGRAAPSLDVY